MKNCRVIIDPLTNINYAAFYIKGLYAIFGKKNISWSSKPFEYLEDRTGSMNFIIIIDKAEKRYTINFNDSFEINESLYNWCDIYGNVNANFGKTPVEFHPKLISLAPSFGIRIWNLHETIYIGLSNLIKIKNQTNDRKYLGKYKKQYADRVNYEMYDNSSLYY